MNTNNYTLDELYTRRNELDAMHEKLEATVAGWVGEHEMNDLESIYTEYEYEPGHWWSSLYHIENAIEEREAMDLD